MVAKRVGSLAVLLTLLPVLIQAECPTDWAYSTNDDHILVPETGSVSITYTGLDWLYGSPLGCLWTLEAPTGKRVEVTIEELTLDNEVTCDDDAGFPLREGANLLACKEAKWACYQDAVKSACPQTCELCDNCNYNHLAIYDNVLFDELYRGCSTDDISEPVASFSNEMSIVIQRSNYFRSLETDSIRITATVIDEEPVDYTPPCEGQVVMSTEGQITDGSQGRYIQSDCLWLITAPEGKFVHIEWTEFDLQDKREWGTGYESCVEDFVRVFDGLVDINNYEEPVGQSLFIGCASEAEIDTSLTSYSNEVTVWFQADNDQGGDGFVGEVTFVDIPGVAPQHCEKSTMLTDPGRIVQSHDYAGNLDCTWTMLAPKGKYVKIEWISFHLEPYFPECKYDNITIYDGDSNLKPVLLTACDANFPPSLVSSGSALMLVFVADEYVSGDGFEFEWTIVDEKGATPSQCEGTQQFTASTGVITDGTAYGEFAAHDTECMWVITAPEGQFVQLRYEAFQLENTPGCIADYVEVRDGADPSGPVLQKSCGYTLPGSVTSTSNQMTVIYYADEDVSHDGFIASWIFVDYPQVISEGQCQGETYIGTDPSITSGIISDGVDGHGLMADCAWIIVAPEGFLVQLTFETFFLDDGVVSGNEQYCLWEYIIVYDGINADEDSRQILTCGSSAPKNPIVSTGQSLRLHYYKDASTTTEGFVANWEFVSKKEDPTPEPHDDDCVILGICGKEGTGDNARVAKGTATEENKLSVQTDGGNAATTTGLVLIVLFLIIGVALGGWLCYKKKAHHVFFDLDKPEGEVKPGQVEGNGRSAKKGVTRTATEMAATNKEFSEFDDDAGATNFDGSDGY